MKKIVLATAFTIGAFYVQAQNHDLPPADQRAKKQTELMDQKLNLDDAQESAVADINLKFAKCVDEVFAADESKKEKAKKMKKINDEKEAALQPLLTPEQFAKYVELKDEFVEKIKERHQ